MKKLQLITFATICLTSFPVSIAAQSSVDAVASNSILKSEKPASPLIVNIYSTEFDISTNDEISSLIGVSIFGKALIMTTKTFQSKLAQFIKSGEITKVNKHFLSIVDRTTGQISGGRQIPVIKSSDVKSDKVIEFINAGYLLKATPVIDHNETNPIKSVSLGLELADNEVDMSVKAEDGIPTVIKREIKANETFNVGNTRIFGGFLSKDSLTRRYFAVSIEIADYSLLPSSEQKR